jgi:acetyl esterase/lipase
MEILVTCLCGHNFAAPPHLAGSYAACPYCGRLVPLQRSGAGARSSAPWIIGGVVVVVVLLVCGGIVGGIFALKNAVVAGLSGSSLEVQQQDYAEARRGFSTKLIRRGPSPQEVDYAWRQEALASTPGRALLTYQANGIQLRAFFDPPTSPGKRPVVIFLHGGFAFGDGDFEMAQPYRDAGFLVVMPILRGENGQSGDFTLYYDEVDDVLALVDSLAMIEHADTNNVFVAGHSAGGALAALSALASNKFRAAAPLCGSMNPSIMLHDPDSQPLIVFDRSDPREVQMRSPEAYARSFKCPARLYYGDAEIFLKGAIERTAATAAAHGLDVQAVEVPGDHFSAVDPAIRQSIPFFRQHFSAAGR